MGFDEFRSHLQGNPRMFSCKMPLASLIKMTLTVSEVDQILRDLYHRLSVTDLNSITRYEDEYSFNAYIKSILDEISELLALKAYLDHKEGK